MRYFLFKEIIYIYKYKMDIKTRLEIVEHKIDKLYAAIKRIIKIIEKEQENKMFNGVYSSDN